MNNNIAERKQALRAQIKQTFTLLDNHGARHGHSNVIATILRHPIWQAAMHVYAFLPCANEPPILPLLDIAITQKKDVRIPLPDVTPQLCRPYNNRNIMALKSLHRARLRHVPISYNVNCITCCDKPLLTCVREALLYPSLILVPGQLFSHNGMRLGRGGGFYDRLLQALPYTVVKVGVCYHHQIVDAVPCDVHDMPVDYLLSECGLQSVQ